jgi:Calcineurin-like phosphoesterase
MASHPVMEAVGSVLNQIDRGTLTDAGSARAAYQAERVFRPGFASQAGVGPSTVGLAPDCIDLLAHYLLAWVLKDQARMNEVASEITDSQCDPGWLTAVVAWVSYYWNGQPPQYVPPSPDTVPFPLPPPSSPGQPLRVGVLGDWGTGQDVALVVLDQLMRQKPDLIIHVGDIYYAGTYDECQTNFLEPIKAAREKYGRYIPVYNLPGNHDYYSGGRAFYAILPQLNLGIPHAGIQQHSFFCLRNEAWQLEGMDTGYNDHDLLHVADDITHLEPVEATWHQQQLSSAGSRQIILFSHHQLFSAFATIGATGPAGPKYQNPFLTKNLQDWRAAGASRIVAWFWGHEHLLEVYAVPGATEGQLPVLGRCVGYGVTRCKVCTLQRAGKIALYSSAWVTLLWINTQPHSSDLWRRLPCRVPSRSLSVRRSCDVISRASLWPRSRPTWRSPMARSGISGVCTADRIPKD